MLANDMKKGYTGTLKNGWKFEVADNLKGVTRALKVYGYATETGSTYIDEIGSIDRPDGSTESIEFSQAQTKQLVGIRERMKALGW